MNRIFGMTSKIPFYVANSVCSKFAPSFAQARTAWVNLYNFMKENTDFIQKKSDLRV